MTKTNGAYHETNDCLSGKLFRSLLPFQPGHFKGSIPIQSLQRFIFNTVIKRFPLETVDKCKEVRYAMEASFPTHHEVQRRV